jgi:hypothetical protein
MGATTRHLAGALGAALVLLGLVRFAGGAPAGVIAGSMMAGSGALLMRRGRRLLGVPDDDALPYALLLFLGAAAVNVATAAV